MQSPNPLGTLVHYSEMYGYSVSQAIIVLLLLNYSPNECVWITAGNFVILSHTSLYITHL